ncbi:MAG: SRPBCC family protein [Muribaculaceae bacterium]|nr:SRPBCC family protein [Muribaculaceae bacterium]
MAKYTGKPVTVPVGREELYERVSNLGGLRERLQALPPEALAKVGDVEFIDADSFAINASGIGRVVFTVTERVAPEKVVMSANTGMVPLGLIIELESAGDGATSLTSAIDVEIPMMLRPMVGGKMKEAADKFSEMIGRLNGYQG